MRLVCWRIAFGGERRGTGAAGVVLDIFGVLYRFAPPPCLGNHIQGSAGMLLQGQQACGMPLSVNVSANVPLQIGSSTAAPIALGLELSYAPLNDLQVCGGEGWDHCPGHSGRRMRQVAFGQHAR